MTRSLFNSNYQVSRFEVRFTVTGRIIVMTEDPKEAVETASLFCCSGLVHIVDNDSKFPVAARANQNGFQFIRNDLKQYV